METEFNREVLEAALLHQTNAGYGYKDCRPISHPFSQKSGRVRAHRVVAELQLGRYLDPRIFDVHHIDDDHSNNNPSNLEVLARRDHLRRHRGIWELRGKVWYKLCRCKKWIREFDLRKRVRRKDNVLVMASLCNNCLRKSWNAYNKRRPSQKARLA